MPESGHHTIRLPLVVSPDNARVLEGRFQVGFFVYRATVREGCRRLNLLRESRAWRQARSMPKTTVAQARTRNAALNAAREHFGLTRRALEAYAMGCRNDSGWMRDHLDVVTAQRLGARAWESFERHLFARAGKPRVPKFRDFTSLVGASPDHKVGVWQSITLAGSWLVDAEAGSEPVKYFSRSSNTRLALPGIIASVPRRAPLHSTPLSVCWLIAA